MIITKNNLKRQIPFGVELVKDRQGKIMNYYTCQTCGRMVSTRLHICPICHTRVRRERI